jgi:hypothetical protein
MVRRMGAWGGIGMVVERCIEIVCMCVLIGDSGQRLSLLVLRKVEDGSYVIEGGEGWQNSMHGFVAGQSGGLNHLLKYSAWP